MNFLKEAFIYDILSDKRLSENDNSVEFLEEYLASKRNGITVHEANELTAMLEIQRMDALSKIEEAKQETIRGLSEWYDFEKSKCVDDKDQTKVLEMFYNKQISDTNKQAKICVESIGYLYSRKRMTIAASSVGVPGKVSLTEYAQFRRK
jgi:peptide subunit release factor 1 (eRF1)